MCILMADENDIRACLHSAYTNVTKGSVFCDGAHLHIIGDDDAAVTEFAAKKVCLHSFGKTRGVVGIVGGVFQM